MRILRLLLCLSFLACALATVAAAGETRDVILEFASPLLTGAPHMVDGRFVLPQGTDLVDVPELAHAMHIRPLLRPGLVGRDHRGPWVVTLPVGDKSAAGQLADISRSPHVKRVMDNGAAEQAGVLGDRGETLFPPHDTSAQNSLFCEHQRHFHMQLDSEDPYAGEWCGVTETTTEMDHDMDLPQAWAISRGDSSIVVAVIDIGTDWVHPALGGPGPATAGSLGDSLSSYNGGVIYRNWNEEIGDANNDGYPGVQGVDDDGDGLVDEDSMLREPGNTAEADIRLGTVTGVGSITITCAGAGFVPGELVNLYLTADVDGHNLVYKKIIGNTADTITTKPLDYVDFPNGWLDVAAAGDTYRIGDRIDSDNDGEIDDRGYLADLTDDDDENSFIDDLRGWDFIDLGVDPSGAFPKGDYVGQDNDPRGLGNHGTEVASQAASSWEYGSIVGVAPGVKILPMRAGWVTAASPYIEHIDDVAYAEAVYYARMMGADVIVTARAWPGSTFLAALNDVIAADGIVHCNGAGNSGGTYDPWSGLTVPNVVVAGLNASDVFWSNSAGTTAHGPWVDVSARATSVVSASPRFLTQWPNEGYTWVTGTSLSGPMAGGVAALIKSVYPQFTRDEIINKMLTGVDNIYQPPEEPNLNSAWIGELGSGRLNAYKALTFYGEVGTVSADTTWTGVVYVSGDIVVPYGSSLTLAQGTVVRIASDDLAPADFAGQDSSRVEFYIEGDLIVEGTAGQEVEFVGFTGAPGEGVWGGIVVDPATGYAELTHMRLRHATTGVLADRTDVQMAHCHVDSCTVGVKVNEAGGSFLDVLVSNCSGDGFQVTGSATTTASAAFDSCWSVGNGVGFSFGENTELCTLAGGSRVEDNAGDGVVAHSPLTLGPRLWIEDNGRHGVYLDGAGAGLLDGVGVEGHTAGSGLYCVNGSSPEVKNSRFAFNYDNVWCKYSSFPVFGDVALSKGQDNIILDATHYDVANLNRGWTMKAENCFWGPVEPYQMPDISLSGAVDLVPFLTSDPNLSFRMPERGPVAANWVSNNYPNPFNPSTRIDFNVSRDGSRVEIDVFDVSGRLVKTLVRSDLASGVHSAVWDGRDDGGRTLSSGQYYARVRIGAETVATCKMMLMK
jgi:hypothetical protein